MKRFFRLSLPALLAIVTLGFAAPASAQSIIIVMQTQRVLSETLLGQDIARQVQELASTYESQLTEGGSTLRSELEDLQRQRDEFIITDEVYEQRLGGLRQRDQQLQVGVEYSRQAMQYAQAAAQQAFNNAITADIETVMQNHNATILIERAQIVAAADDADVTDEIIALVNSRVTSLQVELRPPAPTEAE